MGFFHVIITFTFNQCFHTERYLVSAQNDNVRTTYELQSKGGKQIIFRRIIEDGNHSKGRGLYVESRTFSQEEDGGTAVGQNHYVTKRRRVISTHLTM